MRAVRRARIAQVTLPGLPWHRCTTCGLRMQDSRFELLLQGCKADPIVALTAQEEHARLRKEFSLFFGSANMEKVLARLTREVARSCDEVTAQARAGGGSVTVEMLEMANELIDSIVQHVRRIIHSSVCCRAPRFYYAILCPV